MCTGRQQGTYGPHHSQDLSTAAEPRTIYLRSSGGGGGGTPGELLGHLAAQDFPPPSSVSLHFGVQHGGPAPEGYHRFALAQRKRGGHYRKEKHQSLKSPLYGHSNFYTCSRGSRFRPIVAVGPL